MEKAFNHKEWEDKLRNIWDRPASAGLRRGKPFTVLMPPPNANASLHAGHAMYTVDDIMVRFKSMRGFDAHWIPGMDHAGFETQYVYEKHLAKDGKSRFDFDRKTLYDNIYKFVKDNSGLIYEQFRRMGFMADWDKSVFTLDHNVLDTVYETFKRMHKEGLVYRDNYIVNYCTKDGTSLAELEVKYIERVDPLYYIKYGNISVATVRPEFIFADTHLAVNPKDEKHKALIGKFVLNPLTGKRMEIIGDEFVDPEFGTGIVKLTPAHDANDFAVAKKHNLPINKALDQRGKIINSGSLGLDGLNVRDAREKVVGILTEKGFIEKVDENYNHSVSTCYKCGRDIEPLVIPNWFIKIKNLKLKVKSAVKQDKVKFTPKRYKKQMLNWLEIMHDWPISRQIVWGIRIPVWYEVKNAKLKMQNYISVSFIDKNKIHHFGSLDEFLESYSLDEIRDGLQSLIASPQTKHVISDKEPKEGNWLPETDTFDTWFSSAQWPIVTNPPSYPTDFMGTYFDILKFWISRMIMFGLYLKNEVPFKNVYLWSGVVDSKGQKMSKSKGNVVNPIDFVEKYGADALRMSLMFGVSSGNKVIFSEEKVKAMRNFANKVWNVARFAYNSHPELVSGSMLKQVQHDHLHADDEWILEELNKTIKTVTESLESYKFNIASEALYEFIWHKLADIYIEKIKNRRTDAQPTLELVLELSLKLLHPFMPFVTQAIWSLKHSELLVDSSWPKES